MPLQEALREHSDSTKRREGPGRFAYRAFALRLAGLRERLAQAAVPVGGLERWLDTGCAQGLKWCARSA